MVYYYDNDTEVVRAADHRRHHSMTLPVGRLIRRLFTSSSRSSRRSSDQAVVVTESSTRTAHNSRCNWKKQKSEGYHSEDKSKSPIRNSFEYQRRPRSTTRATALLSAKWTFHHPPPPFHGYPPYTYRAATSREDLPAFPIACGIRLPDDAFARSKSSPTIGQQRKTSPPGVSITEKKQRMTLAVPNDSNVLHVPEY